jgi:hypothetical protein
MPKIRYQVSAFDNGTEAGIRQHNKETPEVDLRLSPAFS